MFNIIKKFKAAKLWVSVLQLAAEEKYEEAYSFLCEARRLNLVDIESTILNIFLCMITKRFEAANGDLKDIFYRIEKSEKYNETDKRYLLAYVCWCNEFIEEKYRVNIAEQFYIAPSVIKLELVSKSLKLNFPLTIHPDWK